MKSAKRAKPAQSAKSAQSAKLAAAKSASDKALQAKLAEVTNEIRRAFGHSAADDLLLNDLRCRVEVFSVRLDLYECMVEILLERTRGLTGGGAETQDGSSGAMRASDTRAGD